MARDATRDVEDATPADASALEANVARIYRLLVQTYGVPPWEPDGDALGGLVATVLSQHTSDTNSARAYARLVERFPRWEDVRDAPVTLIEEAIRPGGLARIKAERIQRILRELTERLGDAPLTLDALRGESLASATQYLRGFSGVGPKTAACVLLFSLGMPAFPVDTHVWRVTKRLGLIGPRVSADAAHDMLLALFPPGWRHTLHVDLIRHGRQICHAQRPECGRCPLRSECLYYWRSVANER